MKRLIAVIFAAVCLLLPVTSAVSAAAELPSLTANASLTVVMRYGKIALPGIHVAVCRVAEAREENGRISYVAAQAFSGTGADFANLTGAKNIALAASLNAYASANNIPRGTRSTDSSGRAVFTGLPAGLYLVAQLDSENSEYITVPYLVSVLDDVTAYPKTEPVNEKVPQVPTEPTKPPSKPGPKTEDPSDMQRWIILIAISSVGLLVTIFAGRFKRVEKN